MSNLQVFLGLMWILMGLSGIFAYKSYMIVVAFFETKRRQDMYPYLKKVTEKTKLCDRSIHSWDRMKLAMPPLEVGNYTICKECGFVAGTELKLNDAGLEVYKNNIVIRKQEQDRFNQVQQRRQELLDEMMIKLVKSNIEKFDGDLHKNIPHLEQFVRKTVLEIDCVYAELNKELDRKDG